MQENEARIPEAITTPISRKLPDTRTAITHEFDIAGHEGWLTVGLYEDGRPGEIFITMKKEGPMIGGLLDTIASLTSLALQFGIPLELLVKKHTGQRFEPSGFTRNPEIRNARSITDYIFRWMGNRFIPGFKERRMPVNAVSPVSPTNDISRGEEVPLAGPKNPTGGYRPECPTCPHCGHQTILIGTVFKCLNCGESLSIS